MKAAVSFALALACALSRCGAEPSMPPLDHGLAIRYSGAWNATAAWRAEPNVTSSEFCRTIEKSSALPKPLVMELCSGVVPDVRAEEHPMMEPVELTTDSNATASTPLLRSLGGKFRSWWRTGYTADGVEAAGAVLLNIMWNVGSPDADSRRLGMRFTRTNQSILDAATARTKKDSGDVAAKKDSVPVAHEGSFVAFGPSRDIVTDISTMLPHRTQPLRVPKARDGFFTALNRTGSYGATRRRGSLIAQRALRFAAQGSPMGAVFGALIKDSAQIDDLKDCVSVAHVTSTSPSAWLGSDADAADDAIDGGYAHLAAKVDITVLVVCNASDSAGIIRRVTSGELTHKDLTGAMSTKNSDKEKPAAFEHIMAAANRTGSVAVVLHFTSEREVVERTRRAVYLFVACTIVAVMLALDALLPLAKVAPTSVGQMGRVSYGFVAWEGFLWAVSLSTIGGIGSGSIASRQILVVDAIAQVLVNVVGMKVFWYVRRAHLQLELPTFARRGLGMHMFIGFSVVCLAGLLEDKVRSWPIVLVANSGIAMQVYHSLKFREDPGLPIATAAKLALARAFFLFPIFVPDTDNSMFWLPPSRTAYGLLIVWLAVQVALLRKDVRRAAMKSLPAKWRLTIYYYGIRDEDVRAHIARTGEADCQICKVELFDDDTERKPSVPAPAADAAPDGTAVVTIETDDTDVWRAPCNHLFHRACLTRWMEERMVCPLCRSKLPKPDSADDHSA